MPFYSRTLRLPKWSVPHEMALYAVGVYSIRLVTCPPNPPPEPPCILTALDIVHRYVRAQRRHDD